MVKMVGMRKMLMAVAVVCGCTETARQFEPDASVVAPDAHERCYLWDAVSKTVTDCDSRCADQSKIGLWIPNSCTYVGPSGESRICSSTHVTAPGSDPGAGCCVYSSMPSERVEFFGCI